jgi:hypothetical protein
MTKHQVSPELHLYAPWAPKIWRYGPLPAFIGQPHVPLGEWVRPQRQRASEIVQKYYKFQPLIANQINRNITNNCLGLHVRWSDKGASRRKLALSEFLPFVQAYVDVATSISSAAAAVVPCIYLATDAKPVIQEIQSTWPPTIQKWILYSQAKVRSSDTTAVFHMESHHITNQEVLRDILELSKCGFLLHGNSAVSEAAIYLNPKNLIYNDQSVNLEDPTHPIVAEFTKVVQDVLLLSGKSTSTTSEYWKTTYPPPLNWWEPQQQQQQRSEAKPTTTTTTTTTPSCQGGRGSDKQNLTLVLSPKSPNDYSFHLNSWTSRMVVHFLRQLVTNEVVVVDPLWYSWMEPTNGNYDCVFTVSPSSSSSPTMQNMTKMLSDELQKQQHVPKNSNNSNRLVKSKGIRKHAHDILTSQMQIQRHIRNHAETLFNRTTTTTTTREKGSCLALHIPDPGYRRNIKQKQWVQKKYPNGVYQEYLDAYIHSGGTCVYLATDSYSIWNEFYSSAAVTNNSTMRGDIIVYTQSHAVRNRENVPAHYMEDSIQRLGSEVLVDVWNLQSCGIMVHGSHPVSEATLYWNPQLHSIHVEDDSNRLDIHDFSSLVKSLL